MSQTDTVYEYLKQNYAASEPIFLADIEVPGMKDVLVRQQMKKLMNDGRVKRFGTGIYYLPRKSIFTSGSMPSIDEVITRKYLMDGDRRCGYISGMMLANRIGITTQLPGVYEVYTNKATTDCRETRIAEFRIIIRKPYVEINDQNADVLQFMDLLKDMNDVAEVRGSELTERLIRYMKMTGITTASMDKYLACYPERIYRNMYGAGLLKGICL